MAFSDMNQHKKMAGAGSTGNFGVGKFPASPVKNPDVDMKHDAMDDSARSPSVKGAGGMMQGAPDHGVGKGIADHFKRDGKI